MATEEAIVDERIHREKHWHDERFGGGEDSRNVVRKYYSIQDATRKSYRDLVLKYTSPGSRILEYGCGAGSNAALWANAGAKVTGIDISTEAIRLAQADPSVAGLDVDFREMDAERLQYEDNTFDVVVGTCILHHLDLHKAYRELGRVLKPGGHAVFVEPLGHNPLINLYRTLTPKMRTIDEHPLLVKDITLGREYFKTVDVTYFHLSTLAAVPFRKLPGFSGLLSVLRGFDNAVMGVLPFMKRYAWMTVIDYSAPDKAKCK